MRRNLTDHIGFIFRPCPPGMFRAIATGLEMEVIHTVVMRGADGADGLASGGQHPAAIVAAVIPLPVVGSRKDGRDIGRYHLVRI